MWRIVLLILGVAALLSANATALGTPFNLFSVGGFVVVGAAVWAIEYFMVRKSTFKNAFSILIALLVTFIFYALVHNFVATLVPTFSAQSEGLKDTIPLKVIIFAATLYLSFGFIFTLNKKAGALSFALPRGDEPQIKNAKILDTSVIVDGRILDIAETGFIDGVFIVPEFVLKEIQLISDSKDSQKRTRGRRALDILNKMKTSKEIPVSITDRDFPDVRGVDLKLLELAKEMKAKVVTNDYNLNKVAAIHEVKVLNINDLSNSLKPAVMPEETIVIRLEREGKDKKQAVGHLEDGTMIVVENARHLIGKDVSVKISTIHQSPAGRIFFADVDQSQQGGSSSSSSSGSRSRSSGRSSRSSSRGGSSSSSPSPSSSTSQSSSPSSSSSSRGGRGRRR